VEQYICEKEKEEGLEKGRDVQIHAATPEVSWRKRIRVLKMSHKPRCFKGRSHDRRDTIMSNNQTKDTKGGAI